jgi:hypothetical protein
MLGLVICFDFWVCSGFEMKLAVWGNRATDFDAKAVHLLGQEHVVVAILVGTLV